MWVCLGMVGARLTRLTAHFKILAVLTEYDARQTHAKSLGSCQANAVAHFACIQMILRRTGRAVVAAMVVMP